MVGKPVELHEQFLILLGIHVVVRIHREGVGCEAVIPVADGQVCDGGVRLDHLSIRAGGLDGGGQEALAAPSGEERRLLLRSLGGLVGKEVIAGPAGGMGKAVSIRRTRLVVVEHVAQDAVGLSGIRVGAHQIQESLFRGVIFLRILGGLIVEDDVVAGLAVVHRLGAVIIVVVVRELGDGAEGESGLAEFRSEDIHGVHHPVGVILQEAEHGGVVRDGIYLGFFIVIRNVQLLGGLQLQGVIFPLGNGGPGEDQLVPAVDQVGPPVRGAVVLHGLRHRPGIGVRVIDRPFQHVGLLPVPAPIVVQEDHQEAVIPQGRDLRRGLRYRVLHNLCGAHRAEGGHKGGVLPRHPPGIHVIPGMEEGALLLILIPKYIDGFRDVAQQAALADHVDPGPVLRPDDVMIIGIVIEVVHFLFQILARTRIGVHIGAQFVRQTAAFVPGCLGALVIVDALVDEVDQGVCPFHLLEVLQPAVAQGQRPGSAPQVDAGNDQVDGAGEGGVSGDTEGVGSLQIREVFRHAQAQAGLDPDAAGGPDPDDLVEADADGELQPRVGIDLHVEGEILPLMV